MRWLTLMVIACSRSSAPAPEVAAEPTEEPEPERKGIVAGPRNIVEQPVPEVDPEVPGQGPVVAYLVAMRKSMAESYRECADGRVDAERKGRPALVEATIDAAGAVGDVELTQSSGDDTVDACAKRAVTQAELGAPPPEALKDDGRMQTPALAFGASPE